jgi:hypothetical protein
MKHVQRSTWFLGVLLLGSITILVACNNKGETEKSTKSDTTYTVQKDSNKSRKKTSKKKRELTPEELEAEQADKEEQIAREADAARHAPSDKDTSLYLGRYVGKYSVAQLLKAEPDLLPKLKKLLGKEVSSVLPLLKQSKQIVFKKEGIIMLQCNGYVQGLYSWEELYPKPEGASAQYPIIVGIHAEKRSCYALIHALGGGTFTYCDDNRFNIPLILYEELHRYISLLEIENSVG